MCACIFDPPASTITPHLTNQSQQVRGVVILGTSMDTESERSQRLGGWTVGPIADALVSGWTSEAPTPDFVLDDSYLNMLVDLGLGKECEAGLRDFWVNETRERYRGDDGRKRARMASINLRDRDGLHGRLWDVTFPVLWLHVRSPPLLQFPLLGLGLRHE